MSKKKNDRKTTITNDIDLLNGMNNLPEPVLEPVVKDKKWAMAQLKSKGINNVEVIYSGGHDSGGTDEILVHYADGGEDTWSEADLPRSTYDINVGKWTKPEMTDQQHLIDQLVQPVYDEYGSFASESYYNGKIIWNVDENTVVNSGNYSIEVDEDYEQTLYDGN